MTPEEAGILAYFAEHWGKFVTGVGVIVGFIYKAGHEHQRYVSLQSRVSDLEDARDEDQGHVATMNANLCRIMGHLGIQPVESPARRRSED